MSETASLSSGVAARYATAVFELAREAGELDALQADLDALDGALEASADLRAVIASPLYSRAEQGRALQAVADRLGLGTLMRNTLGLMAEKRRLFVLPALIRAVRARIAAERGEVTAEVVSARKLTKAQEAKLAAALKAAVGKDVKVNAAVDESLIGGLVVKLGSRMIDSSIATRLARMQNAMKEVG